MEPPPKRRALPQVPQFFAGSGPKGPSPVPTPAPPSAGLSAQQPPAVAPEKHPAEQAPAATAAASISSNSSSGSGDVGNSAVSQTSPLASTPAAPSLAADISSSSTAAGSSKKPPVSDGTNAANGLAKISRRAPPPGSNDSSGLGALLEKGKPKGVYGFEDGGVVECKGRAIALRLEPLKPGLPQFERVLGESRQSVTIGSQKGHDVLVREDAVSKKHSVLALCMVHGKELGVSVVDHSTNGTFVNGERLRTKGKRYRLNNGDTLQIKDPNFEADFGWKLDFGGTVAFFTRA